MSDEKPKEMIKTVIKNWLEQDPDRYTFLLWAKDFFEEKDVIVFYKKAIKNAVIMNELGNIYFGKSEYDEACKYYKKAIELDNQPIYECNLGRAYGNISDWAKMIEHGQRAVELRKNTPDDPYGLDYYYEFLAEAYFKAGKLQDFEELFEKSEDFKDEPEKKAVIYNKIGNLYFDKHQYQEAIPYYTKAVELAPAVAVYHAKLGSSYRARKRWEAAEEAYLDAIRLEPTNAGYQNMLGNIYYESERFDDSIEYYERAIKLDKNVAVYHANLGGSYRECGLLGHAEKEYQAAIKHESNNAVYYNELGNIYFTKENYEKAIEQYEEAIKLNNQPIYECNVGRAYGNLKNWDKMIEHCLEAVELRRTTSTDPYGLDYYYEFLAEAYFRANRLKEFEEYFEKSGDLMDEPKKKASIYNRIGGFFAAMNQYKGAIPYAEKIIKLDSKRPIYECNLGIAYGQLREWDEMIKHCKRAVELRRDTPDDPYGLDYYYDFLSEAYFRVDRLKEFEDEFEKSGDLKDEPEKMAVIYNRIGNLLAGGNQAQKAISYYEKAIELDPKRPIYECNIGRAYGNISDWAKMIEYCTKAVELRRDIPTDPYSLDYYYDFLAEACFKANRLKEFEAEFEKSEDLKAEPEKKAVVYNRIGNLFFNAYKEKESIPYYQRATELAPDVAVYHANLGGAYRALKQWGEALKEYQEAIRLEPSDAGYKNILGNIEYESGRFENSIEYYTRAIDLDNNVAVYHANLGLAFKSLKQWDEAEKALNMALKLDPENAEFQNMLGNVYFDQEKYEKAGEQYIAAIKLDHSNNIYIDNLILACENMQNKNNAQSLLENALKLIPDNISLVDAIGKIKNQQTDIN